MLKAKKEWVHEVDEISEYEHVTDVLQVSETIVKIDDLKKWLSDKGVQVTFFFPTAKPDYLDRQHKCYSPKLAAAIRVWEAVTADTALMHGTTAKQAMMKWLRRHADHYGLTKDDGNPNEQGIEEIAQNCQLGYQRRCPQNSVSRTLPPINHR
jgi:diketogulonate reductase-like aldo/keto reductase